MSLPKYIINFPELANMLNEGEDYVPTSYIFDTRKQRSVGMRLVSNNDEMTVSSTWTPDEEIYIVGIRLAAREVNVGNGDKIDVLLNDELIFENVYFKKEADYKNFRVPQKVKKDEIVEVVLSSEVETEVWVDIDFVESKSKKVSIENKF